MEPEMEIEKVKIFRRSELNAICCTLGIVLSLVHLGNVFLAVWFIVAGTIVQDRLEILYYKRNKAYDKNKTENKKQNERALYYFLIGKMRTPLYLWNSLLISLLYSMVIAMEKKPDYFLYFRKTSLMVIRVMVLSAMFPQQRRSVLALCCRRIKILVETANFRNSQS